MATFAICRAMRTTRCETCVSAALARDRDREIIWLGEVANFYFHFLGKRLYRFSQGGIFRGLPHKKWAKLEGTVPSRWATGVIRV